MPNYQWLFPDVFLTYADFSLNLSIPFLKDFCLSSNRYYCFPGLAII